VEPDVDSEAYQLSAVGDSQQICLQPDEHEIKASNVCVHVHAHTHIHHMNFTVLPFLTSDSSHTC